MTEVSWMNENLQQEAIQQSALLFNLTLTLLSKEAETMTAN